MRVKTMIAAVAALAWVGPAAAQPLVREAAGANPAAIQAAVDAFRTDLGGVNNGNAPDRSRAAVARSTGTAAARQPRRHSIPAR